MSKENLRTTGFCILLVWLCSGLISSCKPGHKLSSVRAEIFRPGDCRNTQSLLDSLKSHRFVFETLSSKLDCDAKGENMKGSFEVTLRMKRDSLIWMSVNALGGLVKVAKILITQDSVFLVNYMDKGKDESGNEYEGSYFRGDFSYVNKMLQSDFDFDMVQSILLGNSVTFYEENEKLHSYTEDGKCVLSTIRKRKLRQLVNRNKDHTKADSAQTIWMDPPTHRIARILFNDFNTKRSFDASYSEFNATPNGLVLANKASFVIKAEKNLTLQMQYKKINLNKTLEFPLIIPEGYRRIYIKDANGPH
jgi:hypothetical protein